jgi:putative ABC transport system permease protein
MLSQDFRYAVRLLAGNPGFAVVALLTLALGIGANTAIFSVIDTVLLRPAPVRDLDRLAVVWEADRNTSTTREPASLPDYLDFRQRGQRVDQIAAFMGSEVNYTPDQGEPTRLQALEATHELLPMLGVTPIAGRGFTAQEAAPGGAPVILLSDGFWTRAFGRDLSVIGRAVRIDDRQFTVIGIMQRGADFGVFQILSAADYSRAFADRGARAAVDVWLPFQYSPQSMPRSTHPIFMVARMRAPVAAVQEELAAIAADLERAYPENLARGVFVEPLATVVFGPVRPALLVLLAAVALVLLVACANVANLLLARGSARRREVAVRSALGASGWRLMRQFAAEGLLLAFAAAVIGAGLAVVGVRLLVALAPADIPRIADAAVDLRVLAVALLVAIGSGLAFGMVPALQARRVDLQGTLKGEGGHGGSAGSERTRLRSILVVAECALAVMLVIGASLLIKSFWRIQQVDAGFRPEGILKAEYQLPQSRYPVDFRRFPDFTAMHAFTRGLLEKALQVPGVDAAAIAGNHPLDPGFTNSFRIVGREAEAATQPEISVRRVTSGYFRTMGVPLVRGRLLADSDTTLAPPVVLINEATARRFFESQEPLGKQITFWGARRTIVGVIGNERFHGVADAPPIAVYAPLAQAPSANGAGVLLVKTSGDASAIAPRVRDAIRAQDPALAVFGLEPFLETMSRSVAERRFTMLVLGLLAAVALVLAAIGVHGVLSYSVTQRTREIGIRMALGAQPGGVRRLVVKEGMLLAAAGALLGATAAFALTGWMASLLFGVTATDPITFAAVPLGLVLVALAASYFPARRATSVDPVSALRGE